MKSSFPLLHRPRLSGTKIFVALLSTVGWLAPSLNAQPSRRQNPVGKVVFTEVSGGAHVSTNNRIEEIAKRSVYETAGLVIETDKAGSKNEAAKTYATMVYSNGTAAYLGADTRMAVKKFEQEPFKAARTDMKTEPSISHTQAFVAHGTVALSTGRPAAGSSMIYETPFGTVNIRGQKLVIETNDDATTFSVLDGECTVQAGSFDLGGHVVKAGQDAIIRSNGPSQPNIFELRPIPPARLVLLDDITAMAGMAQKTVYFEVKEVATDSGTAAQRSGAGDRTATDGDTNDARITAFDGTAVNGDRAKSYSTWQEISPVNVVPVDLPVLFTVSPAVLISPGK